MITTLGNSSEVILVTIAKYMCFRFKGNGKLIRFPLGYKEGKMITISPTMQHCSRDVG